MAEKKKFVEEFKKFIARGNVMDLAVGLIIGTTFTAIVKSLVNDIVMPIVGMVLGGVNFNNLRIVIREAVGDRPELALTYGNFIQAIIDFVLIALVVFIMVRSINTFREKRERAEKEKAAALATAAPPEVPVVPADIVLLTEIRDLLKKKKD
ncbi:MAG: large-conductance mechanosensitive channel [Spirochaetes bacterium GWF2_52_7]|nr:MAG: large-conductance mechanosensitive channel [Spirochaetes bacterium GWF2_52_7]